MSLAYEEDVFELELESPPALIEDDGADADWVYESPSSPTLKAVEDHVCGSTCNADCPRRNYVLWRETVLGPRGPAAKSPLEAPSPRARTFSAARATTPAMAMSPVALTYVN